MKKEVSPKFFNSFFGEIESTFGGKYPAKQVERFYHRVSGFDEKVFDRALEEVCSLSHGRPTMMAIYESLQGAAKSLNLFPAVQIDHDAAAHCKQCMDSGKTLRKLRKDHVNDFYCNRCNKYAIHDRYTHEQIQAYLDGKPIPKDNLGDVILKATDFFNLGLNNWPYCVIKALIEVKDLRNITLSQIKSLVKDTATFQKYLIEVAHGKDYNPALEDQTLRESFLFFCVKTGIIIAKEEIMGE